MLEIYIDVGNFLKNVNRKNLKAATFVLRYFGNYVRIGKDLYIFFTEKNI